jgi:uncharacterized Zn-finger protein
MNNISTHGAHSHSANHRVEIESSNKCGCFYCREIFSPDKVNEWVDEDDNNVGTTALCPYCGIDSVIGDASGYPITKEFLESMYRHWFS